MISINCKCSLAVPWYVNIRAKSYLHTFNSFFVHLEVGVRDSACVSLRVPVEQANPLSSSPFHFLFFLDLVFIHTLLTTTHSLSL